MRIFEKNYSHQKMRNKISHKPVHVKNEARLVDFGRKSIGGHARYGPYPSGQLNQNKIV
jgi:hypothetical protein